jgi:hypothetical protein
MEDQIKIIQEDDLLNEQAAMYEEAAKDIQGLVTAVSKLIANHPILAEKNFGLYYQHGRLGYIDLDAFAKSINLDEIMKKQQNETEE